MTGPATRATVTVFSLFTAGLLAGAWTGSLAAERARDPYAPLDTLARVMGIIQTTWVDEISTDELVQAAIDGMVDHLDPHSAWLSSDAWRGLQQETHGSYTGIGVEVRLTDEGARITRVLPGSPASRDGLTVGDLILTVDGRPLRAADLSDAQSALLGPRGERATLEVLRDGWQAPRTLATVRDEVQPPIVVTDIDHHVAYARITQFAEGAAAELGAALDRLDSSPGYDALVLDLRDDPGGLLREAVDTVDLFLDGGVIVSTWGRMASERRTYEATPGAITVPVVVLVNGLSASASEIVAGAFQDTGRGTLVGTRTYGKGSVQTVFEYRDGSALKLTIGRYYTPSGEPVAPRDGRVPDVVVPWPDPPGPAAALRARIGALDVADDDRAELLALVDALPPVEVRARRSPIPWEGTIAERLPFDPQLSTAMDLARAAADAP